MVYVSQSEPVSQSTPLKKDNNGEDAKLVFLDFFIGSRHGSPCVNHVQPVAHVRTRAMMVKMQSLYFYPQPNHDKSCTSVTTWYCFMLPPINTSHLCSFHGNHNKRQNIFCMLGIFYLINFYLARKLRKVLFSTLLFILSVQWIWMHKWRFTVTAAQYIFIWVSIWKNFLFNAIKLCGKQKQVLQANIFDIEARYDPNIR